MNSYNDKNCQHPTDLLISKMEQDNFTTTDLETLCQQYPDCASALRATYKMWQALETIEVPEPSQQMHTNFYKTLAELSSEESQQRKTIHPIWSRLNPLIFRWLAIASVFVLGILVSPLLYSPSSESSTAVNQEKTDLKEPAYTQLIASNSTTNRLQGIQMLKDLDRIDNWTIDVLFETLISDRNVNVRLTAIETMLFFQDNPKVRSSLIKAIPYQDDPLIQLTLGEVLLALKDQRAIDEIRQLLDTREVEVEVKIKLEDTIEQLL